MTYHPKHSDFAMTIVTDNSEIIRRKKALEFVTGNNWLLPTDHEKGLRQLQIAVGIEPTHEQVLREQGQQILIEMEPPVFFNEMVSEWLPAYFRDMPWRDVQMMARDLQVDVPAPRGRAQYVIALVWYFRSRWS